ncbi:BRICK 1 protein [Salpingoeca rosetta]|uniref:BRICK 1 protein n=1 Tax=Salpingoeca rosetta (strain ATCC 50818 / BSB-021) TaxID=946362 RepID=F2UFD3_SALR5|nr:BRICK 1 protein [Salpingoeca rosetta]EGD75333.1 BRICK 1 protein [Salpingoeca rosetta]|eukprot:XP_004992386.1 BRICK 1 protein [Salpingoeca rosetta]
MMALLVVVCLCLLCGCIHYLFECRCRRQSNSPPQIQTAQAHTHTPPPPHHRTPPAATMADMPPTPQSAIQADWQTREFVETISSGIRRITEFLNDFDNSTRYRLAVLNEKLGSLERSLEFVEAKIDKATNRDS